MKKKRTQSNLAALIKPYRKKMYLPLFLAWLSVILFILQSTLIAHLFSELLNKVIIKNSQYFNSSLKLTLVYILLILIFRPCLLLIKDLLLQKISISLRHNVREKLLKSLSALGPARSRFGNDGEISSKILDQVDALDGYISKFYIQRSIAVLTPIVIVIAVYAHSKLAALLLLFTAPLVPLFMVLVGSSAAEKSKKQLTILSRLSGSFLDLIRGMPTLRRLDAIDQAEEKVANAAEQYRKKTMSVLSLAFLSGAVLELFASISIAMVAVYLGLGLLGILPWAEGFVPVPYESALFILLLAPEFYAPLRQLGNDYHSKAQAEAAAELLWPILNSEFIDDNQSNKNEIINFETPPSLNFSDVSIQGDNNRQRLARLSIFVESGQRVGITGESGVGKSSLFQAVLGFTGYKGDIYINNINYSNIDKNSFRSQIGYLSQTATLLPGTISYNLKLANPNASDEQIKHVLKLVELWDLVERLPHGIDTKLGERGQGLSGGQQQRLSIAQLLLRDSKVWLLDEPAEHLDDETAIDLYLMLDKVSKNKTVLIISHNISHITWLDNVFKLGR